MHNHVWNYPDVSEAFRKLPKKELLAALIEPCSDQQVVRQARKIFGDRYPELMQLLVDLKEHLFSYGSVYSETPAIQAVVKRLARDTIAGACCDHHGMFRYHIENQSVFYVHNGISVSFPKYIFDFLVMENILKLSRNEQYETDWFMLHHLYCRAAESLKQYKMYDASWQC